MYTCYRELIPSTGVQCASFFQIFNSSSKTYDDFLVVASSCIHIYQVRNVGDTFVLSSSFSVPLFGKVRDMVSFAFHSIDGIAEYSTIVSMDDCKIVIIKFNPHRKELETCKMYNVEEGAIGRGSELNASSQGRRRYITLAHCPYVAVNDRGTLSCTLVYGQDLFFIPLQSIAQELTAALSLRPFFICLSNYGLNGVVRDIAFVKGCALPTLAILQEFRPLPLGHLSKVKNTCSLIVVAVDAGSGRIAVLWRHNNLPHDSFQLVPIQMSKLPDCILVISMNAVLVARQEGLLALATTGFAATTVAIAQIHTQPWPYETALELDASLWMNVGNDCVVGTLKNGILLSVQLQQPAEKNWKHIRFQADILGRSIRATCLCISVNHNIWFLGSRLVDSLLLSVQHSLVASQTTSGSGTSQGASVTTTPASKRARRTSKLMSPEIVAQQKALLDCSTEMEDEERLLYGSSVSSTLSTTTEPLTVVFTIAVADSLPVLGPVVHGAFTGAEESLGLAYALSTERSKRATVSGNWSGSAAAYIAEREAKDCLLLSVGADEHASLCRISRGFRLTKLASRDFFNAFAIRTVEIAHRSAMLAFLSAQSKTRLLQISSSAGKDLEITEVGAAESGHVDSVGTIAVGLLAEGLVAQVFSSGVRLIQVKEGSSNAVQDIIIEEDKDMGGLGGDVGEVVVSADILQDWVLLSTSISIYLLQLNDEGELELRHQLEAGDVEGTVSDPPQTTRTLRAGDIACASLFYGVLNLSKNVFGKRVKPSLDERRRAEELFLYGHELDTGKESGAAADVLEEHEPDSRTSMSSISGVKRALDKIIDSIIDKSVVGMKPPETDDAAEMQSHRMYLVVIGGCSGDLRVYTLQDLHVVLHAPKLAALPALLPLQSTISQQGTVTIPQQDSVAVDVRIARVGQTGAVAALSPLCLVLMLQNDDVVVYIGCETGDDSAPTLNHFRKFDHGAVSRRRRLGNKRDNSMVTACRSSGDLLVIIEDLDGRKGVLISGYHALLLSADHGAPFLMPLGFPELPFSGENGSFRLSPLRCGDIRGVVSLWKECDSLQVVRMSTLGVYKETPGVKTFPNGLVTAKHTLARCTVHKCIELLPDKTDDKTQQALLRKKTFVFACSEEAPRAFTSEPMTAEEQEADNEEYDRFYPNMQSFCQPDPAVGPAPMVVERQYKLIVTQGNEIVDTFPMKKDEVVLDIDMVSFYTHVEEIPASLNTVLGILDSNKDKVKKSKRKVFVAVSTTLCDCHGEDTQGEGRLLLLDLDYALYQDMAAQSDVLVDPSALPADDSTAEAKSADEEGTTVRPEVTLSQSQAQMQFLGAIQPKLRQVWSGYGPATVVKQIGDYLLSTVGPTVYLYRLVPESMELEQVAQFYAQFYVATVSIMKAYILLVDAFKSVQFIAFREADMSLNLVAKDFCDCFCMSASYLVDGGVLGMVVCDDESNIRLLRYNPSVLESKKGFQLVRLADIHIGADVAFMLPHRLLGDPTTGLLDPGKVRALRPHSVSFGARLSKTAIPKTALVVGTMEGGLGLLLPVDERTYRRLAILQQIMSTVVESACGLNPREFRVLKSSRVLTEKRRGVLDGSLLFRFVTLDPATQMELTGAMGTTVDMVMDNLLEIDLYTSFF